MVMIELALRDRVEEIDSCKDNRWKSIDNYYSVPMCHTI